MKLFTIFGLMAMFLGTASNAQNLPGGAPQPSIAPDLWPSFKSNCESSGGFATPVPNKCAALALAATQNINIIYTSIPDGSSPNSKCCVKCSTPLQSMGNNALMAERKCKNSNGAIWIPANPPGCCFKPSPTTSTRD